MIEYDGKQPLNYPRSGSSILGPMSIGVIIELPQRSLDLRIDLEYNNLCLVKTIKAATCRRMTMLRNGHSFAQLEHCLLLFWLDT